MENIDAKQVAGFLEPRGLMGIVGTISLGFVAGATAKLIMSGKDPGGLILTTLLGIGGASLWVDELQTNCCKRMKYRLEVFISTF